MKKLKSILFLFAAILLANTVSAQATKLISVNVVATATAAIPFKIANDTQLMSIQVNITRVATESATGTISVQGSNDGVNWFTNPTTNADSITYANAAATSTVLYNGKGALPVYHQYRLLVAGAGSGTVNVTGWVNPKK